MIEPRGRPLAVWAMVMVIWVAVRVASPEIFADKTLHKKKSFAAASARPNFLLLPHRRAPNSRPPIALRGVPILIPAQHPRWNISGGAVDERNETFNPSTNPIPLIFRDDAAPVQTKSRRPASPMITPTGAAISANPATPFAPIIALPSNPQPANKNWQIYAYSFWRASPGGALPQTAAAAAQYGSSQTGIQAVYKIAGEAHSDLSLLARLTVAPKGASSSEWAGGVTWKPNRNIPLRIAGEYRQRSNNSAVNKGAVAVYIAGGVDDVPIWQRLRASGFGQAGWVQNFGGIEQASSLFLDAGARVERNILDTKQGPRATTSISLGGGAWAGGQRGSQRLDIGPAATIKANIAGQAVRLQADWRFRIGGNARPGDGPAVTLSAGF